MRRVVWILLLSLTVSSCRLYDTLFKGDVVARAGKDVLYRSDIERLGINGFSPEDSIRMVERYIHAWAKDRLLLDMAESRLSKADRDVTSQLEEYRRQLLVYRYEQQYVEQRLDTAVSEQEYREYYDAHPESFITHVPLILGQYIKISDNSPNLNPIRTLYRSRGEEDQDRLAQLCYTSAEKYWVFKEWISLDAIMDGIGADLSEIAGILDEKSYFERSYLGYTYLVSVDSYVPSGRVAPYDYCRGSIRDMILSRRKQELLISLERNLLNDAIGSEKLIIYKEKK